MSRSAPFPAAPLRDVEHRHRRLVRGGFGALLILSLSPIFGHHLSARVDAALLSQDHFLGLCLIALHTLVEPVHTLFHALLMGGVAFGLWDRARAAIRLRRTLSLFSPDGTHRADLDSLVRKAGLTADQVCVVSGLPNPAFTAGWLRPRVYLADAVCDGLTNAELTAVLRHEAEHVRRRDPLRQSVLRFFACTFFWIPAFRGLAADVNDEAEITADDAAAREEPLALASAILTLALWPQFRVRDDAVLQIAASGVAGLIPPRRAAGGSPFDALLDRRVRRLVGESVRLSSRLTRRSLVGALATLCLVWTSGIIVAHPMHATAHGDRALHCIHSGVSAFTHVFCLYRHDHSAVNAAGTGLTCPHLRTAA